MVSRTSSTISAHAARARRCALFPAVTTIPAMLAVLND
jgi:hypothetical protein